MKEKPSIPPRPSLPSSDASAAISNRTLKLAWAALNGDYPKRDAFNDENDFRSFSDLYNILRTIWRLPPQKRKEEEIKELLQEAKISSVNSGVILNLLRNEEAVQMDKYLLQQKPRLVSVVDIKWRISVVISTSYVSRSLTPCVQLLLTLSDGRVYELEMKLQKFHQLRHTIASILKEMQTMEALPIMQK